MITAKLLNRGGTKTGSYTVFLLARVSMVPFRKN